MSYSVQTNTTVILATVTARLPPFLRKGEFLDIHGPRFMTNKNIHWYKYGNIGKLYILLLRKTSKS